MLSEQEAADAYDALYRPLAAFRALCGLGEDPRLALHALHALNPKTPKPPNSCQETGTCQAA